MIQTEIHKLLQDYWSWLKEETELQQVGEFVEITTPFLDRHNDYIQIYARPLNGDWLLTDDGYTLRDLKSSGVDITDKREQLLTTILQRLGIDKDGTQLVVHSSRESFPRKKHDLVQAIISVGDLFHTSSATVFSLFLDEVNDWLRSLDVRYVENVKFTGKSGYDYQFDAVIPPSRRAPERVLRVINRPDRIAVERMITSWIDTREARSSDSVAIAVLNDSEKALSSTDRDALKSYDIQALAWSEREKFAELVTA